MSLADIVTRVKWQLAQEARARNEGCTGPTHMMLSNEDAAALIAEVPYAVALQSVLIHLHDTSDYDPEVCPDCAKAQVLIDAIYDKRVKAALHTDQRPASGGAPQANVSVRAKGAHQPPPGLTPGTTAANSAAGSTPATAITEARHEICPRNWTEDAGHENGDYYCSCVHCGQTFTGHKRRVVCKVCAEKRHAVVRPQPTPEQMAEKFHELYEVLAPGFSYVTRLDTRLFDPASPNGMLMVAVCHDLLKWQTSLSQCPDADAEAIKAFKDRFPPPPNPQAPTMKERT